MSKRKSPQEIKVMSGCLSAVFVVAVVVYGIWTFNSSADEVPTERVFTESEALVNSRRFVEPELLSPSSAEFSENQAGVTKINDTVFDVKSYVDSQNAFGAMIRSTYYCTVIFSKKSDSVRVEDLKIE